MTIATANVLEQPSTVTTPNEFSQLLNEYTFPKPERGDILQGEILQIAEDVLYIDVGSKRDAIVPYEEVSQLEEQFLDDLSEGDEVPVYVTKTPFGEGHLWVSLERGLEQLDWERAEKDFANEQTLELEVINHNKGGIIVAYGRISGFVPNSHIALSGPQRHVDKSTKAKLIGTKMPVKIIELDLNQNRFVLSATAAQAEQRQARLAELRFGDVVKGYVVGIKKYGAFVDIGHGLTGLVHISKIAWEHINHPSDVVAIGDEIEVLIEGIDLEKEQIGLNRKELLPSPWQKFSDSYAIDDLLEGRVTSIVDFGAFVEVEEGIEGLLHRNDMRDETGALDPEDFGKGEMLLVQITSLDIDRGRLGLKLIQRMETTE